MIRLPVATEVFIATVPNNYAVRFPYNDQVAGADRGIYCYGTKQPCSQILYSDFVTSI